MWQFINVRPKLNDFPGSFSARSNTRPDFVHFITLVPLVEKYIARLITG